MLFEIIFVIHIFSYATYRKYLYTAKIFEVGGIHFVFELGKLIAVAGENC